MLVIFAVLREWQVLLAGVLGGFACFRARWVGLVAVVS
jgi:hypothetical protein